MLLTLPSLSFAQTKPITGVMNIKFRENQTSVRTKILQKGGQFDETNPITKTTFYKNLRLGSIDYELVAVKFINSQLYEVSFLHEVSEANLMSTFEEIRTDLDNVYGGGEFFEIYKTPYEKGDGYEITAIKSGKGEVTAFWRTPNAEGNDNYISLEILPDLIIKLKYQDGTLIKRAIAARNEEIKTEY